MSRRTSGSLSMLLASTTGVIAVTPHRLHQIPTETGYVTSMIPGVLTRSMERDPEVFLSLVHVPSQAILHFKGINCIPSLKKLKFQMLIFEPNRALCTLYSYASLEVCLPALACSKIKLVYNSYLRNYFSIMFVKSLAYIRKGCTPVKVLPATNTYTKSYCCLLMHIFISVSIQTHICMRRNNRIWCTH